MASEGHGSNPRDVLMVRTKVTTVENKEGGTHERASKVAESTGLGDLWR